MLLAENIVLTLVYMYLNLTFITSQMTNIQRRVNTLSPAQKYNKMVFDLKHKTTHWYERYSPNYGYEPYWVGGDWVLMENEKFKNMERPGFQHIITEQPIMVCGSACESRYRKYRWVCATSVGQYVEDSLNIMDPPEFKSFRRYCDMLAWNCQQSYDKQYLFLHLGPCRFQRNVYVQITGGFWESLYRRPTKHPQYGSRRQTRINRVDFFVKRLIDELKADNLTTPFPFFVKLSMPPRPTT
ncbi:hypothetical protein NE865_06787 [Phthorimaea operculella]|nr:hypothetical protein NE865_06787 [Phthorimaea operculella]